MGYAASGFICEGTRMPEFVEELEMEDTGVSHKQVLHYGDKRRATQP